MKFCKLSLCFFYKRIISRNEPGTGRPINFLLLIRRTIMNFVMHHDSQVVVRTKVNITSPNLQFSECVAFFSLLQFPFEKIFVHIFMAPKGLQFDKYYTQMIQQESKNILGLQLPTDPRWVDLASISLEDILTDHAYCEQKAATSCISLIQRYPDKHKLV